MLQVDPLTCLVFPPADTTSVVRQAIHLTSGPVSEGELPTVHLLILRSWTESIRPDALKARVESIDPALSVALHPVSVPDEPGAAGRALRAVVDQIGAGLVVVGEPPSSADTSRSADGIRDLMDELQRPVFVVPGACSPDAIENILVPTDLSGESLHALRHATELADGHGASVGLLHVVDTTPYVALTPVDRLSMGPTTLTEHRAQRRLQQFLDQGRTADVPIHTQVVFGDPSERISRSVAERDVDVLVLGADDRPSPFLNRWAQRFRRGVGCPVLLVRAGDASLLPGRSRQAPTSDSGA